MTTELQKRLAHNIVGNTRRAKPRNKKELVISSGYSPISAEASSTVIINQKGVQNYLKKLGFHSDNAKRVVSEILSAEHEEAQNRLKAADMVFKVEGTYAAEKSTNLNVNVDTKALREAIEQANARFRAKD